MPASWFRPVVGRLGNAFNTLREQSNSRLTDFPFKYPLYLRIIAHCLRLVSWRTLVRFATRPGFRNPLAAVAIQPDDLVPDSEGFLYLQRQLDRIVDGERMEQPSPAEGRISHEQWSYFHLRHAELHLSFHVIVDC